MRESIPYLRLRFVVHILLVGEHDQRHAFQIILLQHLGMGNENLVSMEAIDCIASMWRVK